MGTRSRVGDSIMKLRLSKAALERLSNELFNESEFDSEWDELTLTLHKDDFEEISNEDDSQSAL